MHNAKPEERIKRNKKLTTFDWTSSSQLSFCGTMNHCKKLC